jgi:hypothetical protein
MWNNFLDFFLEMTVYYVAEEGRVFPSYQYSEIHAIPIAWQNLNFFTGQQWF